MSSKENLKSFIFYVIQYQPENNLKLEFSFEDEIINDLYCKKIENEKSDYLTEIYYFKRNQNSNFKVTYGNNQVIQILNNSFIFLDKPICYSQIKLSTFEKFKIYKKFIEKFFPDSKEILDLLYYTCINLFSNIKMDFVLIMEIIVYLNEKKNQSKLIFLLSLVGQFEIDDINMAELNNSKEKYLDLINTFDIEKINISKINSENFIIEKGKIIIMIYLYICLDFPKFHTFYKTNHKSKELILEIITKNKTIENIYISNKILIKFKEKKIKDMLNRCQYFENYLFLYYSFFLRNKKIINNNLKDSLNISNNDNLDKIIQYYKTIYSNISNLNINKQILKMFNKYCELFEKNQNIVSLIRLKSVIVNKEFYIKSINNCIINLCENLYFSNIQLMNFLKLILISIDKLKGNFNFGDLWKKIDIENMDENFIKEFKNLNLKNYFNLTIYYSSQIYLIDKISDLKNMGKVLQIIDFNYNENIEEENRAKVKLFSHFYYKFRNLLETYNNKEFFSLIKILQILISNDENVEDIKIIILILEKKLTQNDLTDIFAKILDEDIFNNKEINEYILNYFIEKCLKYNQIDIIMNKITNPKYIDLIMENKKIQIPKEDEFFIKEETPSLQILKKFIEGKYLNDKNVILKKGYSGKINSLIKEMKDKILNKKFNIKIADDILKLNEIDQKNLNNENIKKENLLDSRLKLIFTNDEVKNYDIKTIKEDLLSYINKASEIIKNIEEIYSYLKEFYKIDQRIDIYSNIKNKLSTQNLNEYKNIMKEAVTYKTLYRICKVILQFKQSSIFMKIFYSKKEKFRNDDALSEAIATYNEFYEIIKNENIAKLEKNEELLDLISSSYKNFDDLKECIKQIIILESKKNKEEGLDIFNSIKEETFEKIYLFHRKTELRNLMRTFEKFSKIFGYNEIFSNQCDELNIYLQKRYLLSGFDNIKKIITQWDKNLFIKKQNYEVLLFELFQKEQLMNFIKDKNEEDISNLRELIDPAQSQIITQDDIEQLADIIKLKDKLKGKANSENFFIDLSNFIIQTYKNDDGISKEVKKIRNISDKILDIIEIYTKKLDKNVYAENKFESISKNGIFDIIFNQKGYICNVISEKIIDKEEEKKKRRR